MVELSKVKKASVAVKNQTARLAVSLGEFKEATFVTKGSLTNNKHQATTVTLSNEHPLFKKVKIVPTMEQKGLVFFR